MEKRIKKSYICRNVKNFAVENNYSQNYKPQIGDVGIFEILEIGKHSSIQSEFIRNYSIFPSDYIMAAFGTRYATEQFEGYLPNNCGEEVHILGAGGTVGVVSSMHSKFDKIGPTKLRMVGTVVDKFGQIINTKSLEANKMCQFTGKIKHLSKVILSVGSSMDSGKTTTAANFVYGLKQEGYKVAFVKLTGTVFTKDCNLNYDMGADIALDFSEYGFPSTFMCSKQELLDIFESLTLTIYENLKPDYIVMEIADGIYQRETKILLQDHDFMNSIYGLIFSAGDSLAALNGTQTLTNWGLNTGFLSGLFTASPLLVKEVMENSDIPVFNLQHLRENAHELLQYFENKMVNNYFNIKQIS